MRHPKSEIFSDYLDGELPLHEAEEMEAHLEGCAVCTSILRDLREIQAKARSLEDQVPGRDLWPEIARAIQEGEKGDPQVIRLHPWTAQRSSGAGRSGFRLSYIQAVAAGLVLALFSGGLGAILFGGSPRSAMAAADHSPPWVEMVSAASPGLGASAREVARLEESLAKYRDRLEPETARILEKNLAVIDRAIRESVRALEADPGNAFLESHLARSVEIKANYLREAAAFVVPVS